MKKFLILAALILSLPLISSSRTAPKPDKSEEWADSVLSTLSLEQQVAQLFVPRLDVFDSPEGHAQLERMVRRHGIGGFLLGKGTVKGYAALINTAHKAAKVPPLVTLDGEWGLNMRVSDAPQFPYNMTLGAITDSTLLYRFGRELARQCRAVGISVDFAPVLDVNSNPANPVIGFRSFGQNPEKVAALGIQMSRGMQQGGILPVAKHFPGHGDTDTDSHKALPVVSRPRASLEQMELLPFKRYINVGPGGIMIGHLSVTALDRSGTPASLSPQITTSLLRNELGFNGLIFTDALAMKGAVSGKKNNCVAALKAGADVILAPANTVADMAAVVQAVKKGTLKPELIRQKCRKLLIAKHRLGLHRFAPANLETVKQDVCSPQSLAIIEALSNASITAMKNTTGILPLRDLRHRDITIALIGLKIDCPFAQLCQKYAPCRTVEINGTPTQKQLETLRKSSSVIMAVASSDAAAAKSASLISQIPGTTAVFFINPYKMAPFAQSIRHTDAVLCAYQPLPALQRAAAQGLFGGIDITGRFPVNVNGIATMGTGTDIPKTRLAYPQAPSSAFSPALPAQIDSIISNAIAQGAMTGCQVAIAHNGEMILEKAYGTIHSDTSSPAVTTQTLFDIASLTKTCATTPALMRAYDEGLFSLDEPISVYIPALDSTDKAQITPRQLLLHESGMPAAINIFRFALTPESYTGAGNPTATAQLRTDIFSPTQTPLFPFQVARNIFISPDGIDQLNQRIHNVAIHEKRYDYSDLNFTLLKEILENTTGVDLDQWLETEIYAPLGLQNTLFTPLQSVAPQNIAATETDRTFRHQKIHGTVHDETAACFGGISGNAGLFSTASNLTLLCQMLLCNGAYGGEQIIRPETVELFTKTRNTLGNRALGFDLLARNKAMASPLASPAAYGHTGFTGTCAWTDPKNNLTIVFLSNRVNPSRNNPAWNRLTPRAAVINAVYNALL